MKDLYDMGDSPILRHLRSHHDPLRLLLPLHVLRKHQRLQLRESNDKQEGPEFGIHHGRWW